MPQLELSMDQLQDFVVLVSARNWKFDRMVLSGSDKGVATGIMLTKRRPSFHIELFWNAVYSNQNTGRPGQWMIGTMR